MKRENKKENIAALNRETILSAAEKLFCEKGVKETTIDDISKLSDYSRRTIYSYYDSKEDILFHIIYEGLFKLKINISAVLQGNMPFLEKYFAICNAIAEYQFNSPQSANSINSMQTKNLNKSNLPEIAIKIFAIGTEINELIADYFECGKKLNLVHDDIDSMKSVYIFWANITSLLTLVENKGSFLEKEFHCQTNEFLLYGYKQIINCILEERI